MWRQCINQLVNNRLTFVKYFSVGVNTDIIKFKHDELQDVRIFCITKCKDNIDC